MAKDMAIIFLILVLSLAPMPLNKIIKSSSPKLDATATVDYNDGFPRLFLESSFAHTEKQSL